MTAASVA